MWDLFWNILLLFSGIAIGRAQIVNSSSVSQINHMQDLINQAYEKRDYMKQMWIDAEEKAETWERRYMSLIPEQKEESIGS